MIANAHHKLAFEIAAYRRRWNKQRRVATTDWPLNVAERTRYEFGLRVSHIQVMAWPRGDGLIHLLTVSANGALFNPQRAEISSDNNKKQNGAVRGIPRSILPQQ